LSWRLRASEELTRRSGDGGLFQARGAATANERSPTDDVVRSTATEPDAAALGPVLAVAATYDISTHATAECRNVSIS